MADQDVDPVKLEEERLMRSMSRQGKPAGKPVIAKKAAAEPAAAAKKETAAPGAVPKWKQVFDLPRSLPSSGFFISFISRIIISLLIFIIFSI